MPPILLACLLHPPARPSQDKEKQKGSTANPPAVWDITRVRPSDLKPGTAIPLVDRVETKKSCQCTVLNKAGLHFAAHQCNSFIVPWQAASFGKLSVRVHSQQECKEPMLALERAKTELEAAWKAGRFDASQKQSEKGNISFAFCFNCVRRKRTRPEAQRALILVPFFHMPTRASQEPNRKEYVL